MVIAWLYNIIDKTLHGSVAYVETATEIWTDLKERYSQGNEIRVQQLKREIALTTQGNLNVTAYFTKLKELWNEFGAYQQIPIFRCLKDFSLSKFQEREKVHQFLLVLDSDQFETIRSNILAIEPFPNLNKVYSMVLREERQHSINKETEPLVVEVAAFKASATGKPRQVTPPKCSYFQLMSEART